MLFPLALGANDPRGSANECKDIDNCRRLFDIVWGSLATIFLCIWVSVHPNLPPPRPKQPATGAGIWHLAKWRLIESNAPLLHRVKLMVTALIAPEIIVGFAGRQLLMAQFFSQQHNLPLIHGFFIVMGGFVDADGHPIVTNYQLATENVLQEIRAIDESDLAERSKGDVFSKGIALLQGIWFIATCLARRAQKLPLTELEVATLAFATLNALTWLLWLGKPLDVRNPIKLSVQTTPSDYLVGLRYPAGLTWLERSNRVVTNLYNDNEYDALSNSAVPTFWCAISSDYERLPNSLAYTGYLAQYLCGTLFGAIHCAAWASLFPSVIEMWLWRVSALVITLLPIVFVLLAQAVDHINQQAGTDVSIILAYIAIVTTYSLARAVLLVLPLLTLRSLPAAVFMDVNWSVYIPHL